MFAIITSDRFREHTPPPGHPEHPQRAEVMRNVAEAWRAHGGCVVEPRPATREELSRVHDERYLELIADTAGRAVRLDPDTFTSSESHEIAQLAAGAALTAVDRIIGHSRAAGPPQRGCRAGVPGPASGTPLAGAPELSRAFAFVRPPGAR